QTVDIADYMRRYRSLGVLPHPAGLQLHTGEAEALGRKDGSLLFGQAGAQRNALESAGFIAQAKKPPAIALGNGHQLGKLLDGLAYVLDLGRRDFQCPGRDVAGKRNTVTVEDLSSARGNGLYRYAVPVGLCQVVA